MEKRKNYEGMQYRGGRKKGTKNLKRLDDGRLQNAQGVVFTEAEKKALESLVNRANRKRVQMLKYEAKMPRYVLGVDTGQTMGQLHLMGKESDLILTRKSKSLQRFTTREDFDRYIKYLEKVNSKDYLTKRIRLYKQNTQIALQNVFGDASKDVQMKIRMMKPDEYMRMVESNEEIEIGYIYDEFQLPGKLNRIRAALHMKLKEEPIQRV